MQSKHFTRFLISLLMLLLLSACSSPNLSTPQADPPTSPSAQSKGTPTDQPQPTQQTVDQPMEEITSTGGSQLTHLWALRGAIANADLVNVATGAPQDDEFCGTPGFDSENNSAGEVLLTLNYAPSIIPQEVIIWLEGSIAEITRVEVMNTTSGLGREVYTVGTEINESSLENDSCNLLMKIPFEVDFEVDTVFIALSSLAAATRVDSVEIVGTAENFLDAPVFWRIPLPAAPVSIVVDPNNQVFVADELNNIYKYDLEGNLLSEMTALSEGMISDISIDPDNNLVFSDQLFGTYTIITSDGEKKIGGGDAPSVEVAVQPDNGKLFLLDDLGDPLYLVPYFPGTDEIINPLPLDDIAYTGLAFSPENRLFTIRPIDGFLAELDPITGQEIYSIPLKSAEYIDALPVDFSIDDKGNFYVLFERNDGNSAIALLDANGAMLRRLGTLTEPVNGDWPEGSFFQPRSIAVTADGRFALIVDGEAGTYYLTCLLMRED